MVGWPPCIVFIYHCLFILFYLFAQMIIGVVVDVASCMVKCYPNDAHEKEKKVFECERRLRFPLYRVDLFSA